MSQPADCLVRRPGGESGRPPASRHHGTVLEPGRERNATCTRMERKTLGTACRRFPPAGDLEAGYKGPERARTGCWRIPGQEGIREKKPNRGHRSERRARKPLQMARTGPKNNEAGSNGAGLVKYTVSSLFPLNDKLRRHAPTWFYMVLHSPPSCTKWRIIGESLADSGHGE